jgi:hypothetical protein
MTPSTAVFLVVPLLCGVAAGYCLGGRMRHVSVVRLRALWLLWAAALIQAAAYAGGPVRDVVTRRFGLCLVFAPVAVWFAVNVARLRPVLRVTAIVIAVGALLNLAPIVANGRMPYTAAGARAIGLAAPVYSSKNAPADGHTRLAYLGDSIPIPPLHKIASPGDVLIALGTATFIAAAMRRRREAETVTGLQPVAASR